MGIGTKLNNEIMAWGSLAIIIVIVSVVLLKFKNVSGVTASMNTTIDTFVAAFSEPKNWVIIVIVGVIGFALFKLFRGGAKGN